MTNTLNCQHLDEQIGGYLDGNLNGADRKQFEIHLKSCLACRKSVARVRSIQTLMQDAFSRGEQASERSEQTRHWLQGVTRESILADVASRENASSGNSFQQRLGAAPWWLVSLALHVLIIVLAGLVTMAIELPRGDDGVIMVTELQARPAANEEPQKQNREAATDALAKQETPPADAKATGESPVVVPPEILARAELGDHFETIDPDRPDTHSAYGSEDAKMFHSMTGSADDPGGGGMGGAGLDDVIGIGGAASKGSGGGFGGGDGAGIGVQSGAGKGSFGSRNGGGRKLMVKRFGGSPATESAVDKALEWLAYHQEADGHWDIKKYGAMREADVNVEGHNEATSALATLAFLGAGHTPKVGAHKDNVKRAVQWLMSRQTADGDVIVDRKDGFECYDFAITTLALCEAYGMTRDPAVGEAAQKGIDRIVKEQKPSGLWSHSGNYGSTSVTGWMIMALKSAKVANLKVPIETMSRGLEYLKSVTEKDADGYLGRVEYGPTFKDRSLTITAVGMLCFQFLGMSAETAPEAEMLAKDLPNWKPGIAYNAPEFLSNPQNLYYWYYGSLAMFQAGGEHWKNWNKALKETLLPNQRKNGDEAGSWDPVNTLDECGGRVYTTAMGALCLEVYYRYAKLAH